ncbi:hypothetical protein NC651_039252 [Populus alba x Populus x berolinensis]|nr:hypothetical protein NC651_039252 [Populus alba x Populus x berolinensis]
MDRKKAPSRLLVDEAINDDNSVITLNPATLMEQLDIFRRDNLLIKGKKRRGTVLCMDTSWLHDGVNNGCWRRQRWRQGRWAVAARWQCRWLPYLTKVGDNYLLPLL